MAFVIFDTEFLADKGLFEPGFDGWKNREVIQIAAVKVSDTLEVVDEFNLYLKPKIHSALSDYFIQLTGITNELVDEKGLSFPQGYRQFRLFAGDLNCYSHVWDAGEGIGDGEVMAETMAYYHLLESQPIHYKNIAPWFKSKYKEKGISIENQASGDIAELLGCEKELSALGFNKHNALYDVYSILCGLKYLQFKE